MKKLLSAFVLFIAFSSLVIIPSAANGQKPYEPDTSYYEVYWNKLTTRLYLAQKYLKFTIPSPGTPDDIEYKANTNLNMGVGVTWHNFSLNLFYGFSFLNKDDEKGITKGLDLQVHLYPRKWAIDVLAAFPKSYYLFPKGYAAANSNSYYVRPDIKLTALGLSAYRVPNKKQFSYRAAITQNEWQKKSAGSILYGGEMYYGTLKGDSALVPKSLQNSFPQAGITNIRFISFGPGIGYAYTLVIAKHFFITASAVGNLDVNFTSEDGAGAKRNKVGINPSVVHKAAVGYNSSSWNVSANWAGSAWWMKSDVTAKDYYLPAGAVRLVLATKFPVKKHHHA
jgi:hypothetical protein